VAWEAGCDFGKHLKENKMTIKQIADDLRAMSAMATGLADEMDKLAKIDLSGLQLLLGGTASVQPEVKLEVQPAQALPKDTLKNGSSRKGRKMTLAEKAQIRLLYKQSNQDKDVVLPQLAAAYRTSRAHIANILFCNTSAARATHLNQTRLRSNDLSAS
jgi:hypothetical protein